MSDVITKVVSTKHATFGKREQTIKLDYTDVSREELIELATRSLVIDQQAKARNVKDQKEWRNFDSQEVNVRRLIDNRKKRKTTEEKVAELLKDMSEEKRAEVLAAAGLIGE